MSDFPYDPWQKCQTRSGLAADLVISALQKEIRRNNAENAATLAYEMLITSEDMEEYLWFRLKTISVEDVGLANPMAAVLVGILDYMRKTFKQKDRSSDEMYNWIMKEYKRGNLKPIIPDYAVDKHTLKGQMEGRNEDDFYSTGSQVSPEWPDRDKTYRERILKILEENKKN